MDRVHGKVIVVVGGALGIGRAIGRLLGARGATVLVADSDRRHSLEAVQFIRKESGTAHYLPLDVRREESWAELLRRVRAEHGRIDGLISAAGAYVMSDLAGITDEKLQYKLEINLWAICMGMEYCLPVMAAQGQGFVVNIPAIAGDIGSPGAATYGGNVDAIVTATNDAARKYGPCGLLIDCVHPREAKDPDSVAQLVLDVLLHH